MKNEGVRSTRKTSGKECLKKRLELWQVVSEELWEDSRKEPVIKNDEGKYRKNYREESDKGSEMNEISESC